MLIQIAGRWINPEAVIHLSSQHDGVRVHFGEKHADLSGIRSSEVAERINEALYPAIKLGDPATPPNDGPGRLWGVGVSP